MAQDWTHVNDVLSKVKLGNKTYYLKDAEVRDLLDTFGSIVTFDKADAITDGGAGIPDADQVYDFVVQQVASVGKAINLKAADSHTAVAKPAIGDFVVESDGSEWLYDGHEWREVGSENAYVLKTQKVAGVDLADDITVAELQTALGLKALAYKDNGSVTISTLDSIDSFNAGKAGEYSVAASKISVPASYDSMDVTPAGSVEIIAGTAAGASYDKTTGITVSSAAAGEGTPNYTPSGSVTVTNVSVTPSKVSVAKVTSDGQAYALTDGSVVKADDTKSKFATTGLVASIDENDSEMLVFSDASTADAVTAAGGVTYTAPVLSGSLPTFGSESVVSGITSAEATASFSGDGAIISASPSFTATAATMTQPTFTGSFEGTAKSVTPTVKTSVEAAGTDGKVTVAGEDITPTFKSTNKTANVVFGVNA